MPSGPWLPTSNVGPVGIRGASCSSQSIHRVGESGPSKNCSKRALSARSSAGSVSVPVAFTELHHGGQSTRRQILPGLECSRRGLRHGSWGRASPRTCGPWPETLRARSRAHNDDAGFSHWCMSSATSPAWCAQSARHSSSRAPSPSPSRWRMSTGPPSRTGEPQPSTAANCAKTHWNSFSARRSARF